MYKTPYIPQKNVCQNGLCSHPLPLPLAILYELQRQRDSVEQSKANYLLTQIKIIQLDSPMETHRIDAWLVERMTVPGQYIVTLCPSPQGVLYWRMVEAIPIRRR